jgi:AcrR family transcriptional regulator
MEGQPQKLPNARQRSQEETRRRLLDEAARLFAENGSHRTTTKEVATAAGVAVGTLYLHFKDKDGLLKDVLRTSLTRLKQELGKHPSSGGDGPGQVQIKMEALADFTHRFPHLAAVLFDPANLGTPAGREAHAFLLKSQENGLMAGISAGYYRGDIHSGLVARALVGILVEVLGWWGRNSEAASRSEVVETLVEMRLNGLKPLY